MANAKEQLVSAQMLHDVGWLNTALQEWKGGTKTWGQILGNPQTLMTINGFLDLPCKFFTMQSDHTVTSHTGCASLKNHKWKSDITEFDRLLRWKDFEDDNSSSTGSTDDPSTLIRRVYVTSSFGFSGWNVTNLTKSADGTCSADVQIVMTPPDGTTTAAKQTYYWTHLRTFKTATSASQPTALGPITFFGSFTKGSTGYMYSNAVNITMYGVSSIDNNTLEYGSDAITQSCFYEEAV